MNILSLFKRKPKYRRLEMKYVSWLEGDRMIKENANKSDDQQWHIAKEEDNNRTPYTVYLERRELIKK